MKFVVATGVVPITWWLCWGGTKYMVATGVLDGTRIRSDLQGHAVLGCIPLADI